MKILVTGTAGFIGFHLAKRLIEDSRNEVVGLDVINDYYDVNLKFRRLELCGINRDDVQFNEYAYSSTYPNYKFLRGDIADFPLLQKMFDEEKFEVVINLAAQAGVRYSLENPHVYIQSNLVGFTNILECCRHHKIKHLLYASSSSVYGMCNEIPFSEEANVDYPVSVYAATKKSNELLAHSYSHLFHLPTSGLRFFTVYGPWGRLDMAAVLFTRAILAGEPIKVFNNGDMLRDFTFIDDIVEGIIRLIPHIPNQDSPHPYYQIFNIGNSQPVKLIEFIETLEKVIGRKAIKEMMPMQPGDVKTTYADNSKLEKHIGYKPSVSLEQGLSHFIRWYKEYYSVK